MPTTGFTAAYVFGDREGNEAALRVTFSYTQNTYAQAEQKALALLPLLQQVSDAMIKSVKISATYTQVNGGTPAITSDVTRLGVFVVSLANGAMTTVLVPSVKQELLLVDDTGKPLPVIDSQAADLVLFEQALTTTTDEYGTPIVMLEIGGLAQ